MTALTDATVENALKDHLKECVGSYKVAWPNVTFKPVVGIPYYRAYFLSMDSTRLGFDVSDRHSGIFQIDAVVPSNTGITTAITMARTVASQFENEKIVSGGITIKVIAAPSLGPQTQEVDWYFIPVSILYTLLN